MKQLISTLTMSKRKRRLSEIQKWGDPRSKPFTEGQAVIAPGQIGPAAVPEGLK